MARRKGWKIRRSGFRVGNLKALRSFLLMFVLAFGKTVCVHFDKNSYGYDPVISATIYFGMLVVISAFQILLPSEYKVAVSD